MTDRPTPFRSSRTPARSGPGRHWPTGGAAGLLPVLVGLLASLPLRAEPPASRVSAAGERAGRPGAARPAAPAASASLPALALWVEWREVDEAVYEESAGGRQATVTGTAVATAAQSGTWSTVRAAATDGQPDARVRIANGGSAEVAWARPGPVAWVAEVWLEAGPGGAPGRPGASAAAVRPGVALHPAPAAAPRSLALAVRWPGGSAPVAVDLRLDEPAAADGGARSLAARTLVAMDRWTTVAWLAAEPGDAAAAGRGSVGTRGAERGRRLQLRVRLAAAPPGATPAPSRGR